MAFFQRYRASNPESVDFFPPPTHQYGPRGLLLAVTQASGLGLLHLVPVDPTPQLMDQPAHQEVDKGQES